ncbi:hypothetical protein DXT88_12070 [Herbaspirillum lusitanum]|nr:hypothetical protein [Herbaspirillum lusitanum]
MRGRRPSGTFLALPGGVACIVDNVKHSILARALDTRARVERGGATERAFLAWNFRFRTTNDFIGTRCRVGMIFGHHWLLNTNRL